MDVREQHGLQVQQVYDWVTLPLSFRKTICLPIPQRKANDEICGNFSELTDEFTTLWETDVNHVSGRVTLSLFKGTFADITLSINGAIVSTGSGKTFTQVFNTLSSIEVKQNSLSDIEGRYCLDLEYSLRDQGQVLAFNSDQMTDNCYLSDATGNPLSLEDAVQCREVGSRKSVPITLPTQQAVTLQQILIRFEGYISFQTSAGNCLCVFPFCIVREILLCAPEGTQISCQTLLADCLIHPSSDEPNCIDVQLELCESIQVLRDVTIVLEADYCTPRRS
ncbi:S-Ena type endospore appendage [Halobacillus sp. HZG1]|uniref:S-Ena type endospore appendage n=1 Tax=Halobacillus sp. HZG1 TaxID=3111769 RepID=UPI002DBB1430|nr:S-Ena type endospore appendage [Halobacillus sp. HZG1]MEC3885353.1 S-Ena type endospore appendage [Halobacillus sp. HZG1]